MSFRDRLKRDLKADRYNLGHLAEEASITEQLPEPDPQWSIMSPINHMWLHVWL
jgi:hypothetical protein